MGTERTRGLKAGTMHRLGGLKTVIFLTVPETGKSEVKFLANLVLMRASVWLIDSHFLTELLLT